MSLPKVRKPLPTEILTMYIARTAKANYYDVREFFAKLGVNPRGQFNHRIDIFPKDFMDISLVAKYTRQNPDALLAMTFYPLERKFVRSANRTSFELLRGLYFLNRRFCPSCIMEFQKNNQLGIYKSIWQISDVSICDKHHTPLISHCNTCGSEQPYIADSLVEYLCHNCGEELYAKVQSESRVEIMPMQIKKANEWNALISDKIEGITDRPEIVYEVLIAITLLFLLQKNSESAINDIPEDIISKQELSRALKIIKSRSDYFLTPFMLLRYLNYIDITVHEFFNTKVPDWFINRLLDFLKIDYEQLCYSSRNIELPEVIIVEESVKQGRVLKATVESIKDAAMQLRKKNLPINYKDVAQLVGISARYISKRPDFIEAIKEIKGSS